MLSGAAPSLPVLRTSLLTCSLFPSGRCLVDCPPPPPPPPTPCRSFSAVVEDGVIKSLNLEEGGGMTCSLSNQILSQLKQ